MIQRIARINMEKGDIDYLDPIKDYTPVLDERWKDIFPFKNRLPLFGLKTIDDEPYIYIEVTDEQDLDGFLYIKTLRDPDRNKRRYPYNHYIWQLAIVRGIIKGIVFKSAIHMDSNDYYYLEDEIILFDRLLEEKEDVTPQEAIKKLEEYENRIKVGDVVYRHSIHDKRIVTSIITENGSFPEAIQITRSGRSVTDYVKDLHKTNKHYDIGDILKQLEG